MLHFSAVLAPSPVLADTLETAEIGSDPPNQEALPNDAITTLETAGY